MADNIVDIRITRNNIQGHNYDVADYKMCKTEAEITIRALNAYIEQVEEEARK